MDTRKIGVYDADILLVVTPPFFTKMPHAGIAYLASFLKSRGLNVCVYDLNLRLYNSAFEELKCLWDTTCTNMLFVSEIADKIFKNFEQKIRKFVDEFLATDTRVIGFSVNISSIFLANAVAKLIKERDPKRLIIFGGPGTFFKHPRELITKSFADIYVIGEGELTLLNILDAYYNNREICSAPGILLAKDLGRRQPTPPPNIPDLDVLPFPAFSEFDLKAYNPGNDYKPLPLLLSRGCIRRCAYCIDYIMWPKYRFRSSSHIMREITYHIMDNNITTFEIIDLTCNGNLRQLSSLCDLIIDSGLEFAWSSYAIIRKDMDFKLLEKMKKAGCTALIYGVEHGSDRILKKMGKGYTAKEACEVIQNTHNAGICTNINIIVGFPGETEEDFKEAADFIHKNKDYIDEVTNISACTLFPAADIGCNREKYGVCWEDGTEPMLFSDSNGLDYKGRNERVVRLVEIVNNLGLAKSIINKPSLNPQIKALLGLF